MAGRSAFIPAPLRAHPAGAAYVSDSGWDGFTTIDTATCQVIQIVTVLDTAIDSTVGSINLGGSTPQSGDGYEPTGIALTSTPTAGS
jgi:hypothetical protein